MSPVESENRGNSLSPWLLAGLAAVMFLAAIDETIVSVALPAIGQALGQYSSSRWIVTAYILTATAAAPIYGRLSDLYGRKVVLLASIGIFASGSLACALCEDMLQLVAARALQGAGGGGLISLVQIVVADLSGRSGRAKVQGWFAAIFALAAVSGPIAGGVLSHWHWSLIFLINLPLSLLAFAIISLNRSVPNEARPHQRLDILGAILLVLAVMASLTLADPLAVAIDRPEAQTISLAIFLTLWGLFIWRELAVRHPLVPLRELKRTLIWKAMVIGGAAMAVLLSLTVFIPMVLVVTYGLSPPHAGLAVTTLGGGTLLGATLAGRILAKGGPTSKTIGWYMIFLPLLVGAFALLTIFVLHGMGQLTLNALMGLSTVCCVVLGALFPVSSMGVLTSTPKEHFGALTGTLNFFRSVGGAAGVTGFGAILHANFSSSSDLHTNDLESAAHAFPVMAAGMSAFLFIVLFLLRLGKKVPTPTAGAPDLP